VFDIVNKILDIDGITGHMVGCERRFKLVFVGNI
jgi:hypothetical protein